MSSDERPPVSGDERRRLVPFDRHWRRRFEEEKGRLLARLGPRIVAVEHVGATAVAGACARDVVDLLVAVRAGDGDAVLPVLGALGYAPAPAHGDDGLLPLERSGARGRYRLLLCSRTMKSYSRILRFREWLRADALGLLRYEKLRREAIGGSDDDYRDAKERFIAGALDPAGVGGGAP